MLLPLILAIILNKYMSKYRIAQYATKEEKVELAPVFRRALAQLIDIIILFGPLCLGYLMVFSSFLFTKNSFSLIMGIIILVGSLLSLIGYLWIPVCAILYIYYEGKTGKTPGKRITKIKVVGTDLKEIGFARALLRNLLKIVDGFFNFLVGIMIIAFNENYQRIGDMASNSIVIMEKKKSK